MMPQTGMLVKTLLCPSCRSSFQNAAGGMKCTGCGSVFGVNAHGFMDFTINEAVRGIFSTTEEYAKNQEWTTSRICREYIMHLMPQDSVKTVLSVGCGVGQDIPALVDAHYDAYGIDIPALSDYWARIGNVPDRFFCCDAAKMPFRDNFFDMTYSIGVIEHIGTANGHSLLNDDYRHARQQYANEILRVTRPGGSIIIACPNKSFPVDVQHGPDAAAGVLNRIRNIIFKRTNINIHPVWGRYHLLSYDEARELFCCAGGARFFEPLPLKGYFGFTRFNSGFLSPFAALAKIYVDHLPKFLRGSFLNPYMLVRIIK